MTRLLSWIALFFAAVAVLGGCETHVEVPLEGPVADWPVYGRDAGGSRYSPLTQVNTHNVTHLSVAWTYRTGDVSDGSDASRGTQAVGPSAFQATPILVDGTLYVCTPFNRVIALDPETGTERWSYDPHIDRSVWYANQFLCRGVATWLDPDRRPGQACQRRIFMGTNDARLIALDAVTGAACTDFGAAGQSDSTHRVGNVQLGEYQVTSPPVVVKDLVIVGSAIGDNQRVDAPSGVVRAFDTRTGALRWSWEPIPPQLRPSAAESAAGTRDYRPGTANAWSILSVDAERELVFVPTGDTSPDFYGGERQGLDFYSSSVVALRATTGEVVWHFQTVHHDVWDHDVPAQLTLVTVRRNGVDIPAVAQATKIGHLFLLHRGTGEPLFAVEERPVPQGGVPGETLSPTQPFPTAPAPLVPHTLSPDDAWGLTFWDRGHCRERMQALRSDGIFTPPSLQGTIIFPGNMGGTNWGSVAFDPQRGLLLVNTSRLASVVTLIPRDDYEAVKAANPGAEISPQTGTPYGMRREWLLSPLELPCNAPPWGTLCG